MKLTADVFNDIIDFEFNSVWIGSMDATGLVTISFQLLKINGDPSRDSRKVGEIRISRYSADKFMSLLISKGFLRKDSKRLFSHLPSIQFLYEPQLNPNLQWINT